MFSVTNFDRMDAGSFLSPGTFREHTSYLENILGIQLVERCKQKPRM
jgi:hypothetical protein